MIDYTERVDGDLLWACLTLDDGAYMEVPIHGVAADQIQATIKASIDAWNAMASDFADP
jgi:hypothetical protein